MQYTVLQVQVLDSVYDSVNELGHSAAATQYPEYGAYLDTMMGGFKSYKPEYLQYYKPVCEIEADDLNGVFHTGNMGPETSITRLAPMHSVSVGDIIQDTNGSMYMVDRFGFKEIV